VECFVGSATSNRHFLGKNMNIDFHYGVIYVTSRLAGLDKSQAQIVAHSSQYVDDATTKGALEFSGGETFERYASAHEMYDYKNAVDSENRAIWAPFHFLPGGEGKTLEDKVVCCPDSLVAKSMVRNAISRFSSANALQRLGITLHVYVDTWAHQGFSGIVSDNNKLLTLEGDDHDHDTWLDKLTSKVDEVGQNVGRVALDVISGLGHGAALHFPDMPWAKWKYKNANLRDVERDNLPDFVQAADMACKAVQGFINKNQNYENEPGLPADAKEALRNIFANNRDHKAEARLKFFAEAVANGEIPSIAEEIPEYVAKGNGSWKHTATGIAEIDDGDTPPNWSPVFEDSNYRKFHDAIKEHRFVVTQEILPSFQVRLA
jgi:hypothetical protein